ncbi:MAG: hypothetical protein DA405_06430 [Bacteroidetes bacterium]|nr:MAG: hypothetical protein DA405_06430 [Bacteroidota bacterium]
MKIKPNARIAIVGSVNSSKQTLLKLHQYQCSVVRVLGLDPQYSAKVSGFQDLKLLGDQLGYPSTYFKNINDPEIYELLEKDKIDLLFVIGLSQMVREPLINLAEIGNVGYHPTVLPHGRGRGALAWIILEKAPAGVTFFRMDEGMDSGPILGQQEIELSSDDDVSTLLEKILEAIDQVLDEILPAINAGNLRLQEQDHNAATYLGVRKPSDGLINWNLEAHEIHRLVRASCSPLPGAFTYYQGQQITIHKAELRPEYTGIPGRLIAFNSIGLPIITAAKGAISLLKVETVASNTFKIGNECSNTIND